MIGELCKIAASSAILWMQLSAELASAISRAIDRLSVVNKRGADRLWEGRAHLGWVAQGICNMYEAPSVIGTCINCIAPGSLSATLALIVVGAGIALTAERRKLARVRLKRTK